MQSHSWSKLTLGKQAANVAPEYKMFLEIKQQIWVEKQIFLYPMLNETSCTESERLCWENHRHSTHIHK